MIFYPILSAAAQELYHAFDSISVLCQRCCDVMYYFADLLGVTYEQLNMVCFYIVQPCIYSLLLLWQLLYLQRKTKSPQLRKVLLWTCLLPVIYVVSVLAIYVGKNLNTLCIEKIQSLYDTAHAYGMTYAEINIYIFILGFLLICFLHFLFLCFRKKKVAYAITLLFTLLSPFFVYVFNT